MIGLTDKQKQLFQEDKHILVDTIIILEQKLFKSVEDIGQLNNEMLLNDEQMKSIIEDLKEQIMLLTDERNKAELTLVRAQQEIDGEREPRKLTKEEWAHWKEQLDELIKQADEEKNK